MQFRLLYTGATVSEFVPVIDISPWREPDAGARAAIAHRVDAACRRAGFLQLAGHSIPPGLVDNLLAAMDELFALPIERKLALRSPRPEINRGYAPVGAEALAYSLGERNAVPDRFEAFNVGPPDVPVDDPVYAARLHDVFAPNIWPDELPHIRRAIVAYFEAVRAQAHELTDIFAMALDLPTGFFAPSTSHSTDVLRLNHYLAWEALEAEVGGTPAGGSPGRAEQMGMGAHTDYGIATLLLADATDGLEILAPDGAWTPVRPEPGCLLVNLGDLLATWTNDHWRSTLHRVRPARPGTRRRSAAFFHDGNHDALVTCLPTCTSAEDPPRYPPILAGDHITAKLLGPRTLTSSTAISTVGHRLG